MLDIEGREINFRVKYFYEKLFFALVQTTFHLSDPQVVFEVALHHALKLVHIGGIVTDEAPGVRFRLVVQRNGLIRMERECPSLDIYLTKVEEYLSQFYPYRNKILKFHIPQCKTNLFFSQFSREDHFFPEMHGLTLVRNQSLGVADIDAKVAKQQPILIVSTEGI